MKENVKESYIYIWEFSGQLDKPIPDLIIVRPKTLRSLYRQLTSKVIISNAGIGAYLPKRKNQYFINTWHGGGAYKRTGIASSLNYSHYEQRTATICAKQTDYFLSSSEKFTEVMADSKLVDKSRFLEVGMPRNDELVRQKNTQKITKAIKERYNIPLDNKLVLYAPTYRGAEVAGYTDKSLDYEKCLVALKEKFGGTWTLLLRQHLFVKTQDDGKKNRINVSNYPNMQELLQGVDVFITDYSSSMWDVSFLERPGFLYVSDIDQYASEINFYTDPETWPFPLARDNDELGVSIANYDEVKNTNKIQAHHQLLVNKETGEASKKVVKLITEICGGK